MQDERMKSFILVGGTALSLQLGHRVSLDLDLFSAEPFEAGELSEYMTFEYHFTPDYLSRHTVRGEIDGIKVDCITHQYPWLKPPVMAESIRLAHILDIAAMKLNAIAGNGTRIKDFIDIAYMSAYLSLDEMLHAYSQKYTANRLIPLKSIMYWKDINFTEPIKMISSKTFLWEKIEQRIKDMQRQPQRVFPELS
jgi:hypothetical protein